MTRLRLPTPLHRFARWYSRERFTSLFVLLLISIGGHSIVGRVLPVANPLDWLLGLSLVAIVFSVREGKLRWLLYGLVTVSVSARLAQSMLDHPATLFVRQSSMAIACLLAAGVAVRRALATGPVDREHISAALDAYLLVGLAFGAGYWLLEIALPGSFVAAAGGLFTTQRALYFSFVTQATLGYGDIVPLRTEAQGIVIVQAVGGQMYLAVLVARLVSLFSAQARR